MGDNSIYKICKHNNEECYSNDSQGTGHYLSPGGAAKRYGRGVMKKLAIDRWGGGGVTAFLVDQAGGGGS